MIELLSSDDVCLLSDREAGARLAALKYQYDETLDR